jgi:hypothetical protein
MLLPIMCMPIIVMLSHDLSLAKKESVAVFLAKHTGEVYYRNVYNCINRGCFFADYNLIIV